MATEQRVSELVYTIRSYFDNQQLLHITINSACYHLRLSVDIAATGQSADTVDTMKLGNSQRGAYFQTECKCMHRVIYTQIVLIFIGECLINAGKTLKWTANGELKRFMKNSMES